MKNKGQFDKSNFEVGWSARGDEGKQTQESKELVKGWEQAKAPPPDPAADSAPGAMGFETPRLKFWLLVCQIIRGTGCGTYHDTRVLPAKDEVSVAQGAWLDSRRVGSSGRVF